MLQYMEGPTGYMKRFADLTKDYFVYPKNEAAKNCKGVKIMPPPPPPKRHQIKLFQKSVFSWHFGGGAQDFCVTLYNVMSAC